MLLSRIVLTISILYVCSTTALSADIDEYIKTITGQFPTNLQPDIAALLAEHKDKLKENETKQRLEKRLKMFGTRIFKTLTPKMFATVNRNSKHLREVFFLMLVRGNIKDLVWKYSQKARFELEGQFGVQAKYLMNLSDHSKVGEAVAEASRLLPENILNNVIGPEVLFQTGYSFQEIRSNQELLTVYSDELSQAVLEGIKKRVAQIPQNHPSLASLRAIELLLQEPFREGQKTFKLSSRQLDDLKGGDLAGDCTGCDRFNYWTQGSWNSNLEVNELQTYAEGRFFSRMVFSVVERNAEAAIWVHATEFSPQARSGEGSRFLDKGLQEKLLTSQIEYLGRYAKRAGIKSLLIGNISNSTDFMAIVTRVLTKINAGDNNDHHSIQLISSLESSHGIRQLELGRTSEPLPMLLQGWRGPRNFPEGLSRNSDSEQVATATTVILANGFQIDIDRFEQAAHLVEGKMNEIAQEKQSFASDVERTFFIDPADKYHQDIATLTEANNRRSSPPTLEEVLQWLDHYGQRADKILSEVQVTSREKAQIRSRLKKITKTAKIKIETYLKELDAAIEQLRGDYIREFAFPGMDYVLLALSKELLESGLFTDNILTALEQKDSIRRQIPNLKRRDDPANNPVVEALLESFPDNVTRSHAPKKIADQWKERYLTPEIATGFSKNAFSRPEDQDFLRGKLTTVALEVWEIIKPVVDLRFSEDMPFEFSSIDDPGDKSAFDLFSESKSLLSRHLANAGFSPEEIDAILGDPRTLVEAVTGGFEEEESSAPTLRSTVNAQCIELFGKGH